MQVWEIDDHERTAATARRFSAHKIPLSDQMDAATRAVSILRSKEWRSICWFQSARNREPRRELWMSHDIPSEFDANDAKRCKVVRRVQPSTVWMCDCGNRSLVFLQLKLMHLFCNASMRASRVPAVDWIGLDLGLETLALECKVSQGLLGLKLGEAGIFVKVWI